MYLYLYCITKTPHKPPQGVTGLENAAVYTLQYHEITAIASEITTGKAPVSNGNVLCHAAVIEAIRKEQTVLPMRFSSVFHDDTGVIEFLKNRYAAFVSDLERLRDTLEMGLRIVATSKNLQDTESMQSYRETMVREQVTEIPISDFRSPMSFGTVYLQQRRAYYASQDENDEWVKEIVKTCHTQFEDICVEFKRDNHSPFLQGVSLNYLIHKDALSEFKNRFNDLKSSLNELQFLCSGPWPPYHFVSPE